MVGDSDPFFSGVGSGSRSSDPDIKEPNQTNEKKAGSGCDLDPDPLINMSNPQFWITVIELI